jgi:hypothetical protein
VAAGDQLRDLHLVQRAVLPELAAKRGHARKGHAAQSHDRMAHALQQSTHFAVAPFCQSQPQPCVIVGLLDDFDLLGPRRTVLKPNAHAQFRQRILRRNTANTRLVHALDIVAGVA